MNQITVSDADLRKGAEEGMDAFWKYLLINTWKWQEERLMQIPCRCWTGISIHCWVIISFVRRWWKEVSCSLSRMDTDPISLIIRLPKRCVCLGQKISLSWFTKQKNLRCPSRGFGKGTYGRGIHGHVWAIWGFWRLGRTIYGRGRADYRTDSNVRRRASGQFCSGETGLNSLFVLK